MRIIYFDNQQITKYERQRLLYIKVTKTIKYKLTKKFATSKIQKNTYVLMRLPIF